VGARGRLFKYGSGTGSNFHVCVAKANRLSGGGRSSGLMSFLKIGDRAAGAIKSGAPPAARRRWWWSTPTIRISRPYIDWKVKEEQKVRSACDRLQAQPAPPQGGLKGLRQLRRLRRRLF